MNMRHMYPNLMSAPGLQPATYPAMGAKAFYHPIMGHSRLTVWDDSHALALYRVTAGGTPFTTA